MDFIDSRTREIGAMALDGLYERQKAISANTVNILTPGYQRKVVSFEDSLRNIINRENEKDQIKLQNTKEYQINPKNVLYGQTPEQLAFLSSEIGEGFAINVETDTSDAMGLDGTTVNLEEEMMDDTDTAMKYHVVSNLLSKNYHLLEQVIKGQNS